MGPVHCSINNRRMNTRPGEKIHYGYLADHLDMCEEIGKLSFEEWPSEIVFEGYKTAEALIESFRNDFRNGRGNQVETGFVAYTIMEDPPQKKLTCH
jgi:hypothetical protein